jgi:hypothetical protein
MKVLTKNLNKKIIISTLLIILTMGILGGCGSSTKPEAKNPPVKEISEKIRQTADISQMKEGNEAKLKKLFDISTDELDGYVFYMAPSNVKADELLIMKLKDSNNINAIKDKIVKRSDKQAATFKDYAPDEYYLLQKKVIKTKDNYIIYVVSKDAEKISNAFDEAFK